MADDREKNGRRRRRRRRRWESEKERERVWVNEGVIHGAPTAQFPIRGRKVLISRNYVRPAPAASTNFQFLRLLVSSSNSSPTYVYFPSLLPPNLRSSVKSDKSISDITNWPATLMTAISASWYHIFISFLFHTLMRCHQNCIFHNKICLRYFNEYHQNISWHMRFLISLKMKFL